MGEVLHLVFPMLPKPQADVMQHRQRAPYRKRWHKLVVGEVLASGLRPARPWEQAAIACVRFSSTQIDYSNLVYSFKPLVDGLIVPKPRGIAASVIVDDNPRVLRVEQYHWVKTPRRESRVEILVARYPDDLEPWRRRLDEVLPTTSSPTPADESQAARPSLELDS
jgi:hypothetical protein